MTDKVKEELRSEVLFKGEILILTSNLYVGRRLLKYSFSIYTFFCFIF